MLLFGPALACGLVLAAATPARAQHHHAGHAHAHVHHGHGFAHYGHGFGYGGYRSYYGRGYGIGLSIGFGSGYGYGYGYPAYYPSYPAYYSSYPALYSGYPAYGVAYSPPVISTPPAVVASDLPPVPSRTVFAPVAGADEPAAKPNAARIEVRLPDADAEVWVDGRQTRAKGRVRILVSPELIPGKAYGYKVTAAWTRDGRQVGEEKVVEVAAGKTIVVDFTRPDGPDELPFPKERPPAKVPDPK
jgi:uncharacterized protein (TIGR03000 family)